MPDLRQNHVPADLCKKLRILMKGRNHNPSDRYLFTVMDGDGDKSIAEGEYAAFRDPIQLKKNWLEFWLRLHFDSVTCLNYPFLYFLLV